MELLALHTLPFVAALAVMLVLAVLQLVGLGDWFGHPEVDMDAHVGGGAIDGLASVLGIGRLPLLILLGLFLFLFGTIGLALQQLADLVFGAPLQVWPATAITGVASVPLTGALARPLAWVLPGDESTAVGLDALVGRRAVITDGVARANSPARARLKDHFGQVHHVMVVPHDPGEELLAGDEVLLVRREAEAFYALAMADRALGPI